MATDRTKLNQPAGDAEKAPPLYEQIANVLRARVISTDTGQPVRLPPERDLCGIHKVSLITIRRAMDVLKSEGLIERTPSRGTLTVPHAIAQWKRLRQDQAIHVVCVNDPLLDNPTSVYGQVYQGILRQSEQAGYRSSIESHWIPTSRTSPALDLHLPPTDQTLGVIFIGCMNEVMIRHSTDAGYPTVCVDYWTTNPQADAIVIDCYSEGQLAADLLIRQGHTQIFYVGHSFGPNSHFERESDSELLLAGMQRTLVRMGLPAMPAERVLFLNSADEATEKCSDWFLSLQPRPTAGVVFSPAACLTFQQHVQAHGIRCPEDISLITKTSEESPRMACLRAPARTMGELAVTALLERTTGRRSYALRLAIPSGLYRGPTIRQLR